MTVLILNANRAGIENAVVVMLVLDVLWNVQNATYYVAQNVCHQLTGKTKTEDVINAPTWSYVTLSRTNKLESPVIFFSFLSKSVMQFLSILSHSSKIRLRIQSVPWDANHILYWGFICA